VNFDLLIFGKISSKDPLSPISKQYCSISRNAADIIEEIGMFFLPTNLFIFWNRPFAEGDLVV